LREETIADESDSKGNETVKKLSQLDILTGSGKAETVGEYQALVYVRNCIAHNAGIIKGYKYASDVLHNSEPSGGAWEETHYARIHKERKMQSLAGECRDRELLELRLYRLAQQAAPISKDEAAYPPTGELEFLGPHVVEGQTWATFMAFSKAWPTRWPNGLQLEQHLPRLGEVDG